jgi:hypothetical protein
MQHQQRCNSKSLSDDSFQIETRMIRQLKEASKKIHDLSVQLAKVDSP